MSLLFFLYCRCGMTKLPMFFSLTSITNLYILFFTLEHGSQKRHGRSEEAGRPIRAYKIGEAFTRRLGSRLGSSKRLQEVFGGLGNSFFYVF